MQSEQQNIKTWLQSRREFIRNFSFLAGASYLPWFVSSCSGNSNKTTFVNFDTKQYYLLKKVHNILFPKDQFGPGANDFKTVEYLDWVLSDKNLDENDKNYILKGVGWIEESSGEEFNKEFGDLSDSEIEELIRTVSKHGWGESWLSRNLTYIFEAQFSDELYGSNIGGAGWKWLEHYPGYPRPVADMIYDEIFTTISNKTY